MTGGVSGPARRRAIAKANGWYCFQTTVEWANEAMDVITSELEQSNRPSELGPLEVTMTPVGPFDAGIREQYEALGVDRLVFLPGLDAPAGRRHDPVPVDDILRTIDRLASSMAKLMSSVVANAGPRWWPTKVLGCHASFRVVRWVSR